MATLAFATYNDSDLDAYLGKTDEELKAICRKDNLARMELARRRHGLDGDIYFITPVNVIADTASHLSACPDSVAETIADMAQERIAAIIAEQSAQTQMG